MNHVFFQPKGVVAPDDTCMYCSIKRDGSLGIPCVERKYDMEDPEKWSPAGEPIGPQHSPPPGGFANVRPDLPPSGQLSEPSEMAIEVAKILNESADLFLKRNAEYGDNWAKVGLVMQIMHPYGLPVGTEHEHNRYHLWSLAIVKLTRYAKNYHIGHPDSLKDCINYLAMLLALDNKDLK